MRHSLAQSLSYKQQQTKTYPIMKTKNLSSPLIPIYISLTSIFNNQNILLETLQSIVRQSKIPHKIFLYLSEEPYLLDTGFQDKTITYTPLSGFLQEYQHLVEVIWVENQGSYRKLLPLLKQEWNNDCLIITLDDDTVYDKDLIRNMVHDYYKHKCVINYRGFTPKMTNLREFNYLQRDHLVMKNLYNFPTGKGGILYKPQFFQKTHDLIFRKDLYMNLCHAQDDVWFYLIRIKNNIKCYVNNSIRYQTKDLSNKGLFFNFNVHNNKNTEILRKTLKVLETI